MAEYELVYIVRPDIEPEKLSELTERVDQAIRGQGGRVTRMEPWGKRTLTYPLRKQREGHYVVAEIEIEGAKLVDLERSLSLFEEILRHLIVVRGPEAENKPRRGEN